MDNRGRQYLINRRKKVISYFLNNYLEDYLEDNIPKWAIIDNYKYYAGGCKKKHCICDLYKDKVKSYRKKKQDQEEYFARLEYKLWI